MLPVWYHGWLEILAPASNNSASVVEDTSRRHLSRPNQGLRQFRSGGTIQPCAVGVGISADLLPYIFDRFGQGDSSSSKTSQGLGLGLSIVRQLVELHGGTVQAHSPGEGQGTTITVRLPLRSMRLEIAAPSYLEPSVLSGMDALDSKKSILYP